MNYTDEVMLAMIHKLMQAGKESTTIKEVFDAAMKYEPACCKCKWYRKGENGEKGRCVAEDLATVITVSPDYDCEDYAPTDEYSYDAEP